MQSAMSQTKVALIGLGTVGSGVARLLTESGDQLERRAGRRLILTQVVVQDRAKARQFKLPPGILSDDLRRITGDPEIAVVQQTLRRREVMRFVATRNDGSHLAEHDQPANDQDGRRDPGRR